MDERAEVGLISRNITLQGAVSVAESDPWGGETIFRQGFKEVSIQGVEFALVGKQKLGSYPVHFHKDGRIDPQNQIVLFNANSIHHTFNKCVTVHSTQGLMIQNNVCARAVGHLFYEEIGDEDDITFAYNLGLGAMSDNFDIHAQAPYSTRDELIRRYWWRGDNMVARIEDFKSYRAFNVSNHDDQANPTHGACRKVELNGGLGGLPAGQDPNKPCPASNYFEPPSGFWIINPGTKLIGNSIGGCQGVGRAYWFVPPTNPGKTGKPELALLKYRQIGEFKNNRAHSCYAGLYAEPEDTVVSEQLFPHKDGKLEGELLFNVVDGMIFNGRAEEG